ncbi:MAG: lipopolysaccharide export system protein LptA [Candidatus Atribacteria bacterium]|nr:lipopolysaccharide export system protein LptA [Candidatus Atribacteria bacterium]
MLAESAVLLAEEEPETVVIRTSLAEYDEETGKIRAEGESVIEWDRVKIICPFLEIDSQKGEAWSEGEIRILWDDYSVRATSVHYVSQENRAWLQKTEGGKTDIFFAADEVLLDFSASQIRLEKAPFLVIQEVELGGKEIVYFWEEQVWRASQINLTSEGWKGKANRAIYQEGNDYLELLEKVEVEKEGGVLQGEKMVMSLDGKKVRVEGEVEINLPLPQ